MAKAAKLFDIMKNCNDLFRLPVTDAFAYLGVMDIGKPTEYYIDPRTKRNSENLYVVKPITWNEAYFAYVCPYCQEIHIEAVDNIGAVPNYIKQYELEDGQIFCQCKYMKKLNLRFIIDMDYNRMWWNKDDLDAKQQLELHDKVLSFVKAFEKKAVVECQQ